MTKKKAAISRKRAKAKAPSRNVGRPSLYTETLAANICQRLAEGETLRSVCRDEAMPDKATILRWLADKKKADFRDQYAHARDMQADALFDEALEIADDASGDWAVDKDGKKVLDHENIQRSRLRVVPANGRPARWRPSATATRFSTREMAAGRSASVPISRN